MRTLHVLYDHTCGLCCSAAHRLAAEPAYLRLTFRPLASMEVQERFGPALGPPPHNQVIVIADTGEVYRGTSAWLMVLYALRRYRGLSIALSRPGCRPLVGRVIDIISRRRATLSELFGCTPDANVLATTRRAGSLPGCDNGACDVRFERVANSADALRTAKSRVAEAITPA